jgi:hypothetical protein
MTIRHTWGALKGHREGGARVVAFICRIHGRFSVGGVAAQHEDDDRAPGVTFSSGTPAALALRPTV